MKNTDKAEAHNQDPVEDLPWVQNKKTNTLGKCGGCSPQVLPQQFTASTATAFYQAEILCGACDPISDEQSFVQLVTYES